MRLALYAHYGTESRIALHVLFCLQAIREVGFEVVFISNSKIAEEDRGALTLCRQVLERPNEGYDFGMWQEGLRNYEAANLKELLLLNSSIVGPLGDLGQLWSRPDVKSSDFWGLTDNTDLAPHLQSYFMVFPQRVLEAECFRQFWDSILPYQDKMQLIRSYELGLTLWLEQHGFQWRALFPSETIRAKVKGHTSVFTKAKRRLLRGSEPGPNVTLSYPELLLQAGMPFLKASLLERGNIYRDPKEALSLLADKGLPAEVMDELRQRAQG